ncbi:MULTISPECIES: AMP-binding protein [unclassified Gordonia (in: high G+C Gram-positive bacteria)]|uniref:AMP-binding protein n=1 Tax=unclassified Gordonia (in: high G+C Gram-positive bacteria) TaxID=2657482 RepID=UPI001F0D81FE|nr:AMP-binding protein [Gordonia sp. ABSL49_1]MCH5641371.1 alpha/beta fold hydrolase [Gordonia sp. ABSL49_1]
MAGIVGVPDVGGVVGRVVATAQNGLEVLRFGGFQTETEPAPFAVVETEQMYRLRRYFPDEHADDPDIILVPPMMVSANVYDVTELNGAVSVLHRSGIAPWVVDFGSPDTEEGGMERTLADHVVAVSRAIDVVIEATGRDVHLAGYSQGGMFAYQTAAYRRSKGLASVITFGSPVDVLAALPLGLPAGLVAPGAEFLADKVFSRNLWIRDWMARTGFQLLDPVKTVRSRIDFLRRLHDRDALLPREDQRRFLEADGWVAWSGPAIAELLRQFVAHNRMVSGGFVINGDLVSLAEITCPVLAFVGTADDIGQPAAVRGIVRAAPHAEIYESRVPVGHFGLVVGSAAGSHTWPTTSEWVNWQSRDGDKPALISTMEAVEPGHGGGVSLSSRITHGVGSVADAGAAASRELLLLADSFQRTSRAVAQESIRTVPRLFRLGQIQTGTQISLGKLMSENTKHSGDKELFLFENRVLTHAQVNTRIDNVVAGLVDCGVRPGQHIGVLMDTRPSALVVVAALSRLGAVAVMLAADGDVAEMLRLADSSVIVTDPVHLEQASEFCDRVLVLGGGSGDARAIEGANGSTVIDMEQIDPDAVVMPTWYRPDPGVAGDLAFVLFTRSRGRLATWPVTNHRFAMSAFGAASAAGLTDRDTVYCLPPLHHASGLLTTLGATVVGRSRIALSHGVDADTFATEVPRYGITVVSYTWTMMRDVVRSEDFRINPHNPIRLFMGSGMPVGLWDDVVASFPRARVLEFFATADGSAILANVSADKAGSMGRPLPETNPVEIAAVDIDTERLIIDDAGFVRKAEVGEPGLLLSRARHRFDSSSTVLRDVFGSRDRWEVSGHLFVRDVDDDLWFLGSVDSVIRSADGPIWVAPVEQMLSRVKGVDLCAVYPVGDPGRQVAVAAVSLRSNVNADALTVSSLRIALGELPAHQRPHLIRVVDEIPLTDAYRPISATFAREGLPRPGARIWYRDSDGRYRRYTRSAASKADWSTDVQVAAGGQA